MSDDARDELARRQEALVGALTASADVPAGFDPREVATAAAALATKRMHSATKAWPAAAEALGESFAPLFHRYAAEDALPTSGHAEDARQFLRFALRQTGLDDETAVRLLQLSPTRLCPMRWRRIRGGVAVAIRIGRRASVIRLALARPRARLP
jgi:hypothetical protein